MTRVASRKYVKAVAAAVFATPTAVAFADQPGDAGSKAGDAPGSATEFIDAVEQLQARAESEFGDQTFAGAWFGPEYAREVYFAFTQDANERVEQLRRVFPYPETLHAVTVDDSLADLEKTQNELIAGREVAEEGGSTLPGLKGGDYDLSIDIENNRVTVITQNPSQETTDALDKRFQTDVGVKAGSPAEQYSCDRNDCKYDMRAGLRWSSGCTTAFAVEAPSGSRQMLSSGHCGSVGLNAANGGVRFGEVKKSSVGGRADALRMSSDENGWQARRWLYKDDNNKDIRVTGVQSWDNLVINTPVCKSGAAAGWDCGTVTDKSYSPAGSGLDRQVLVASLGATYGDSGSPVVRQDDNGRAVGVLWGGNSLGALFSHIEYVQDAMNASVITSG